MNNAACESTPELSVSTSAESEGMNTQDTERGRRESKSHLELVLFVLGAFVKRPVVAKPPDVVDFIEALDVVVDAVALQDVLAVGDGCDGVYLQVWMKGCQGARKMCFSDINKHI